MRLSGDMPISKHISWIIAHYAVRKMQLRSSNSYQEMYLHWFLVAVDQRIYFTDLYLYLIVQQFFLHK